jgi:hypothetical protein
MTSALRKLVLTFHVTFSVGWLGAAAAYLSLAVAGLTSTDQQLVRATYLAMNVIGWVVIVPLSLAALLAGLVQSWRTEWGFLRHYWIAVKLVLTVIATGVLLLHMPTVSHVAAAAAGATHWSADLQPLQKSLTIHSAGGVLVLLTTTVLSIYKPWGKTPHGRRLAAGATPPRELAAASSANVYISLGIAAILLIFLILHIAGGGLHSH